MDKKVEFLDKAIEHCELEMKVFSARYEDAKKNRDILNEIKELIEGSVTMNPSCH